MNPEELKEVVLYQLLTRAEAARYLGVSPSTLDTYHIRYFKLRRLVRYRVVDLQDFLAKHEVMEV